jgi:hypothetical protein
MPLALFNSKNYQPKRFCETENDVVRGPPRPRDPKIEILDFERAWLYNFPIADSTPHRLMIKSTRSIKYIFEAMELSRFEALDEAR